MSQLKKLASDTAIYGLSSVAGRLLNYLLVPLYTSVFLPGEYGIVTELYAYVAFLNILYAFGLETAYFRFASQNSDREQEYFSTSVLFIGLLSLILSGGLAFSATAIVDLLQYPGQEQYVYSLSAIMAIDGIAAIPFAQLRIKGKAVKFAVVKIANVSLNIGFNLVFLLVLPNTEGILGLSYDASVGVGYVFLANLIANAALIPLLWRELSHVRLSLSRSALKELLNY
ncbi:MAG: oligosaccharide flippase family protein, partial [Bacteroidota bacterium]